jgi:hypothetical protein
MIWRSHSVWSRWEIFCVGDLTAFEHGDNLASGDRVTKLLAELGDGAGQLDRNPDDLVGMGHDGTRYDDPADERTVPDWRNFDASRPDLISREPDAHALIDGSSARVVLWPLIRPTRHLYRPQRFCASDQCGREVDSLRDRGDPTRDNDAASGSDGCDGQAANHVSDPAGTDLRMRRRPL